MSKLNTASKSEAGRLGGGRVVLREYAGKWVAWASDGREIVAVGDTLHACEQSAADAGHPANQVAIEWVPEARQRLTGTGM